MKIYKLTWYLAHEECIKKLFITDREIAEQRFYELREILYKGCWISLNEFVENENKELNEGVCLHYIEAY